MLDAYIIEEIKRQEEERRRRDEASRPRLRIEIPRDEPDVEDVDEEDEKGKKEKREPIRIDL